MRSTIRSESSPAPRSAPLRRTRRLAAFVAVTGLVVYAAYGTMIYAIQRAMLYPGTSLAGEPNAGVGVPGLEASRLSGDFGDVDLWFLPPLSAPDSGPESPIDAPAPVVLFTHGNGELIDYWPEPFEGLRRRGFAVALVEYPGYGRSTGEPSERAITDAIVAAYDNIAARTDVDTGAIFALGRSLGGGAACALAIRRPLAGLALQSTFRSVREMARRFMLPGFLVRDPWDNLAAVRGYEGPVIVFHGTHDEVVPYEHGVSLAEAAPNGELVTQDCGHNDAPPSFDEFDARFEAWARAAMAQRPQ